MKRKTIILLSSVLAGSLLVGGAFAAYAVTDNANPIGVDVRTQASDQDTPVEIMWGEEAHANIADLDSGKYAKAGYFTVKSTVEYEGTFSVKMADKTPQAIIDAKGTEDPVFLFDNLEVFVYSGHVVLEEGQLPAELPQGVELVGSISLNTAKQEDGSKLWSKLVTTDLDGKVFTVLVKSEAADDVLGQLSQDVVGITVDWGMGPNSHEAEPAVIEDGYYLVGTFNNWKMEAATKLAYDEQKQEYSIKDVELAANAEVKVVGHKDGDDDVYYPASTDEQNPNNIPLVAGSYDFYFVTEYKDNWKTGSSYDGAYGIDGHFWIVPKSEQDIDDYIIWGTKDGQLWEKLATLVQDGTQYKVLGLELAKDTEFTIHLNGAVYKEFTDIKTNSTAFANFEAKGGTDDLTKNNIVVKVAGTYDIYADTVADTAGKFVWIEETPVVVGYSATKNALAIEDLDTYALPKGDNNAVYKFALAVDDEIKFAHGETELKVYGYNGQPYDTPAASFKATEENNYTFYINSSDEIWVAKEAAPELSAYKIVGSINNWKYADGIAMYTVEEGHVKAEHVSLTTGDQIKLFDNGEGWLGVATPYDNCNYTVGDDGNCVVASTGTFTVEGYVDGLGGNCIKLTLEN